MLQYVEADTGVRRKGIEAANVRGGGADQVQIGPRAKSLPMRGERAGVGIERDHQLAIQQEVCKIAGAASDLHHSLAEVRLDQGSLPGEIVFRLGHPALILDEITSLGNHLGATVVTLFQPVELSRIFA